MSKPKSNKKHNPVSKEDVARIQSSVAKKNEGRVPKGSYVGRMQAVAEQNSKQQHDD